MEVTGRVKVRSVLRAAVLLPLVNPSSYTHLSPGLSLLELAPAIRPLGCPP